MKNEITKIDPKEFGLQETQVSTIENAFMPMITEREGLRQVYENILTKEITPEVCNEAKTARNKLVKVRTGIANIHKTQKAYFLAAGRFVDAWKNKETEPVLQMESSLKEIEEYYERIEEQRIANLQISRADELKKYLDESSFVPSNLGTMDDQMWGNYLLGAKTAFELKKEAERKAEQEAIRIETERVTREERKEVLLPYWNFIPEWCKTEQLGTCGNVMFQSVLSAAMTDKEKYDKEQQRIKEENERLKAEQEAREKADKERIEKERKEREEIQAKLKAEQEAREKLEAEAKAREKAEAEAKEAELKKGDSQKVIDLINDLELLKCKYQFKSLRNQKMYNDVGLLLDKVINHIKK